MPEPDTAARDNAIETAIAELDTGSSQPQRAWRALRATCPVAKAGQTPDERPAFHVTCWSDIDTVLRDGDTFSSSINAETVGRFMGPNMLALDGDAHRSYRALVAQAFRASQLAKWEQSLILPTINRLIDRIAPKGRAELIEEVVSPFPAQVICGIAGLPQDDGAQLLQWTNDIHRGALDEEAAMAAALAMQAYLEPFVEHRRTVPGDDIISDIIHAEIEGEKLNDAQIYGFLRLLLPAGSESTFRAIANALVALLTMPELLSRISADRSLLPAFIEESLRRDASLSLVARVTTREVVLGGCPIPAGSPIRVFTASANRDETRFDRPDRFDMDRPSYRHRTFGTGQHQCLGMHLARLELGIGLNAILDRLDGLRVDPDFPPPKIEGFAFRGPPSLQVIFNSA
jgi:cytochrome P450